MRRMRLAMLGLLGLSAWGCGPAEFVPMTPPGVPLQRVSTDTMEAEGESKIRGGVHDAASPAGVKLNPSAQANPAGAPAAK